jgi:hypothetical protein
MAKSKTPPKLDINIDNELKKLTKEDIAFLQGMFKAETIVEDAPAVPVVGSDGVMAGPTPAKTYNTVEEQLKNFDF